MKVLLQKDVKDLGKVGDVVNVKEGFARNFLFPRKLAEIATEKNVKQKEHQKKVAEAKKKKAVVERQGILEKLKGVSVSFKKQAGENDKLFGSVGASEISKELEKMGFIVDKKDIKLEEAIKEVGQFKAVIEFGKDHKQEIVVSVEKI